MEPCPSTLVLLPPCLGLRAQPIRLDYGWERVCALLCGEITPLKVGRPRTHFHLKHGQASDYMDGREWAFQEQETGGKVGIKDTEVGTAGLCLGNDSCKMTVM